jgi:hypothetical protein
MAPRPPLARPGIIDELYAPPMAAGARRWIAPFRESFPDVQMEIASTTGGSPRPGASRTTARASDSPGSQLRAERTSNPSSTTTASTPASASRPKKPSMSEPV